MFVPGSTTVAWHDMTAVARAWRGRGLATLLKRATVAWGIREGSGRARHGQRRGQRPDAGRERAIGLSAAARRGRFSAGPCSAPTLEVGEDLTRRVPAGHAGHATARVRARPGQVEPGQRHPVARVAEQRPPGEERIETRLDVERMAAGQAVVALEVERRQD